MNFFLTLVLAAFSVSMAFSRRSKLTEDTCQYQDGSSYRGHVSVSAYGNKCLNWSQLRNPWDASNGIGNHRYCRNPDHGLMPWCYVRRQRRLVREFCDIPKCPSIHMDTELTCGERSERRQHKVVGGSFTPIESLPWVAAIFNRDYGFLCGGSLIAPCWVLTAAHCFDKGDEKNVRTFSVYLGKTAINETHAHTEQSFSVEKLIIHSDFNEDNYNNDIALLKIKSKNGGCAVKSASARTVCLPPLHTKLPAGFQCSIAGFGKEKYESWHYSQYLKQGEVKLLSQTQCNNKLYYEDRISENMICAGSPDWSTDACKGDSGGPLVCGAGGRMFLFGIVSWGEGCAKENKPGVYTQVTNYNKWIASKTRLPRYTEGIMYPRK
ncbi:Urokinase-type plasminogen activator [Channa argus]|uniref:trypsin n=1 Tax=Channa argus TaxID=215402 RepID=A0A6G1R019_CHAAH|nr:Urokinase-type plasminogen activator [Channa argus]KAK2921937.1 hypothetical protein Q8A73_001422 [Channa argus]